MVFKDYYKILGFDSNKVTTDEIKNAYREQAKKYHPDINVQSNFSEDMFKDINEAYRTLSNDKSRRKYDFSWNRYVGRKNKKQKKTEKTTFKERLINMFFGNVTKKQVKIDKTPKYGENVVTKVDVSLEEAFFGAKKRVRLRNIKGKETTFDFKVPAGVQENDKIRIPGQGRPGVNGGKNGDLLVFIHIKDNKKIKLIGTDLLYEMTIKVWEAALGTTRNIQVFGENIKIIVPQCVSSGDKLIIKQKGYKDGKGSRGKLIITIKIELPKNINENQKKLYKKLKEIENN